MKIIVGLGNIGDKYKKNRHNTGFMVIDEFAKELQEEWKEEKNLQALTIKTNYQGVNVFLAKPTTLMNNSGEAVGKILHFFKEKPENLLVIFDDLDLPLGKIRFRPDGSAGTHKGMKSIIQHLGTENFPRLRLGIESRGELTADKIDTVNFVLSNFTTQENNIIKVSIRSALEELHKFCLT